MAKKRKSDIKQKRARRTARRVKNDERLRAIVEFAEELPMDVREAVKDFSGAYSPRVAEWVLNGLARMILVDVVTAIGGRLRCRHVHGWLLNDEGGFRTKYQTALELRAEVMADEIIDIADTSNMFTSAADRLRISTRQWLMERNSGRFGEKKTIVHEGNPDRPLRTVERGMTTEEAAQAWAEMVKDKGHQP